MVATERQRTTEGLPIAPTAFMPPVRSRAALRAVWITVAVAVVVLLLVAAGALVLRAYRSQVTFVAPDGGPVVALAPHIDFAGAVVPPARPVPNARPGGTVTMLPGLGLRNLDPAGMSTPEEQATAALLHRTLTGYIDGPDGLRLVGDLATNAGEPTNGGRTWTYHLRAGVTFADGTAITAADVAHGIARSFTRLGAGGDHYLRDALDPGHRYTGPFDGGPRPPGVTIPDPRTIVFTFDRAQGNVPHFVAKPTTAPVPVGRGATAEYASSFVASGPYALQSVSRTRMVLVRNPHWKRDTDPIRNGYPDSFVYELGSTDGAARVAGARQDFGRSPDASAVLSSGVPYQQVSSYSGDDTVMLGQVVLDGPSMRYLVFNSARVPLAVRQAISYGVARDAVQVAAGAGDAQPATTILPPGLPGHRPFAAYSDSRGDLATARERLRAVGATRLTLCDLAANGAVDVALQANLRDIGLTVDLVDHRGAGPPPADCDLLHVEWVVGYPDGDAVLGRLLVDATVGPFLHLDPALADEITRLGEQPDRDAMAVRYGGLDVRIQREQAAIVPLTWSRRYYLAGPRIGNFHNGTAANTLSLIGLYVIS